MSGYLGNTPFYQDYAVDTFTGNGSTVNNTLTYTPASVFSVLVFVSGVYQRPTTDYTLSGNVLTHVVAPPNTAPIQVIHLGRSGIVNTPADASVTTAKLATGVSLTNSGNTTQTLTDAATTTWDANLGSIALWTMGASRTLAAPTNLKAGGRYVLVITQDATGGRAVTWNAVFKNAAGSMPQPNTQPNAVTAFTFTSPDGTNLRLETNEAMVLLATATASSSASLDFTKLTGFDSYLFTFADLIPATNSVNFAMQYYVSGVLNTSANYQHQQWRWTTAATGVSGAGAQTGIALNSPNDAMASAGVGLSGTLRIYNPASSSTKKCDFEGYYQGSALLGVVSAGWFNNTGTVDGVKFYMDSGNITSGTIKCYGIRG